MWQQHWQGLERGCQGKQGQTEAGKGQMAPCCLLPPGPAARLVSMTIAGNCAPSHQKEMGWKAVQQRRRSDSSAIGITPHTGRFPLSSTVHAKSLHFGGFPKKKGGNALVVMRLQPFPGTSLQHLLPPAKPGAVWRGRSREGASLSLLAAAGKGSQPSALLSFQDKQPGREKKI